MAEAILNTVMRAQNSAASWYNPHPKAAAENARDHVAFGRGVQVST